MNEVFRALSRVSIVSSVAVAAVIAFVDLQLPLGLTVGVLYVLPILISLLADDRRQTTVLAALCSVLVVVGWVFSPRADVPEWIVTSNRLLVLFAIWMTAVPGTEMTRAKQQIRDLGRLLTICAWTKQVRVAEGEWIPVDQYLIDYCGIRLNHGISEEAAERWAREANLDVK